ncbi:MAG: ATP-binding protein, partial [Desulfobacterales bacterium]|nr:ATP-binding protein [Desulfobacterales bacterium]
AALALAHRLDLTHALMVDQLANDLPPEDSPENHFAVMSAEPHPFLSGTIRLRLTCSHPDVHRALKHHETRVQLLLHKINGLISPRFLYSEVVFEIEADGYPPMDMKFSVDAMAAMKLLTGNRLYSDQRVFLRELVQNAVDACNLKRLSYPEMSPDIRIDFSPDYKTIRFRDNGVGMDRQWMEKYFLKIGISFYQSGDSKNVHNSRVDASFISKFGIGFLSSFLAAERVVVTTRKAGQPGLIITIHNLQDYFDVRLAGEDCPEGTEVCLHLTPENVSFAKSMQYVCYLKTNLRFLTVPVTLTDHLGRQSVLGSEPLAYEKDETYACEFVAPLVFRDATGFLFMKTKRNKDTLYALENAKGGVSIFQDGIFVTQTTELLPEGARQNVIGRINLTGHDRCELSMDRNRIFWTESQLRQIKQTIRSGIVALADMTVTGSSAR